jgi:peptidoglycan/xylan/chitin deacetylase (PgdA/CDA1 family)
MGLTMMGSAVGAPVAQSLGQVMLSPPEVGSAAGDYQITPYWQNKGPGLGRRVALTFDDGPSPGVTETVLDELKKRDMKATFFMIGRRVTEAPELARRVLAEGHEVANHTFTHPTLSALSDEKVAAELDRCQEAIADAIQVEPVWFRPPYGAFRKNQGRLALERGLGVLLWSVDPRDWARPGVGRIAQTVLNNTQPGSIVLMHDLHRQTAEAVPQIFDGLIERGFEFTTISGFLGSPYDPA